MREEVLFDYFFKRSFRFRTIFDNRAIVQGVPSELIGAYFNVGVDVLWHNSAQKIDGSNREKAGQVRKRSSLRWMGWYCITILCLEETINHCVRETVLSKVQ